jgi:hypothetical protein
LRAKASAEALGYFGGGDKGAATNTKGQECEGIMNKLSAIIAVLLALAAACYSDDTVQLLGKGKITSSAASYKKMSGMIDEAAVQYEKYGPSPRIALSDFAFGFDAAEYGRLNACGVVMISAQSHDGRELPLKRVYVEVSGKKYPLICLLSSNGQPSSAVSAKVFGRERVDSFYLIPYGYTQVNAALCVDWKMNRDGFVLFKFPLNMKLEFVMGKVRLWPEKGRKIDAEALKKFLIREFSFTPGEAEAAVKKPNI